MWQWNICLCSNLLSYFYLHRIKAPFTSDRYGAYKKVRLENAALNPGFTVYIGLYGLPFQNDLKFLNQIPS